MSHNQVPLREENLQHFWANLEFDQSLLQTENGLKVEILYPGIQNELDGPDFLGAKICIEDIVHFGAVEIHKHSKDWFNHGHHRDMNYDNVILHVVADDIKATSITTYSGYQPPILNIFNALPKKFQPLTQNNEKTFLPCSNLIRSISEEVFERQINYAEKEYLDQKVGCFFQHYNANRTPSNAWKQALFITLCDALGVPFNRESMKESAHIIIEKWSQSYVGGDQKIRILVSQLEAQHNWIRKGLRGVTQPSSRLHQAIKLYTFLYTKELDYFFTTNLMAIWENLLTTCNLTFTQHNQRLFVSFFLPAMYALGVILESNKLKQEVMSFWEGCVVEIPNSILKKFGIFSSIMGLKALKRIGLIHQYNAYCKPLNCSKCKVLNKAISP